MRRAISTHKRKRLLRFEGLKERRVLATVVVGNTNDTTNGDTTNISALMLSPRMDVISLREAIDAANNTPLADTITFDPTVFPTTGSVMIELGNGNSSGEINITDALTIIGPSNDPNVLTIIADANSRIFNINYGTASADPVAMTGPVHCR